MAYAHSLRKILTLKESLVKILTSGISAPFWVLEPGLYCLGAQEIDGVYSVSVFTRPDKDFAMPLVMFDHNDFSPNPFPTHLNATVRLKNLNVVSSTAAELFPWYEERVGRIGLMLVMQNRE